MPNNSFVDDAPIYLNWAGLMRQPTPIPHRVRKPWRAPDVDAPALVIQIEDAPEPEGDDE